MLRNISSVPTKREFLLLAIILTFFIWVSSGVQIPLSIGLITGLFLKQEQLSEEIVVEHWRTQLSWSSESDVLPQTNIDLHAPGWTVFNNLYVANGTVFVVTNKPETIPPREMLISTGIELKNDPESVAARLPTNHEMRIISVEEARELFDDGATLVDGVTWMMNDPPQFDLYLVSDTTTTGSQRCSLASGAHIPLWIHPSLNLECLPSRRLGEFGSYT